MKKPPTIIKYLPYVLLLILIIFNFYLYRGEYKVLSDPNDGNFHFSLIAEARNVWKNVFSGKLSPFYLFDNWNERWADGYSLSLYYSHLPEAVISLISFVTPTSLFQLFVIIRTTLLILLPVSFFIGAQILGYSAGFGLIFAFFSQAIFTDGLYGLDSPSFLWRGWGLFSQLLAVFILPIAFGYAIDYFKNKKNLGKAIIFNFLLAQVHLGMFYLLLFSYPVFWLFSLDEWLEVGKRILYFSASTFIALAYFIVPFFSTGQYRNFSLWDPIWKFDSWGMKQILTWLLNGDLFDFKRFPFLTITVFGGVFWGLKEKNKLIRYFIAVGGMYLALFIGRDFIGPFINIIPGLSEFHLHRTIVMFQFVALLIASHWFYAGWHYLDERRVLKNPALIFIIVILGSTLTYFIERPIMNYVADNYTWINVSNTQYKKDYPDYQAVLDKLHSLPTARIFAGRPGNWGKNFKIGETQVYMALSRDGLPTIGFLPESWSPNSDPEQFFSEDDQTFYNLYNVGYLLMPTGQKPPKFARSILTKGKFSLYQVDTDGWFGLGKSSQEIISKKTNLLNVTHLWFSSNLLKENEFPVISLSNRQYAFVSKIISMTSLNSYISITGFSGNEQTLWQINPLIDSGKNINAKMSQTVVKTSPQKYEINFHLDGKCNNCVLVLKQTYHPNWHISVNGKPGEIFPVFPFFIGIKLGNPGNYKIIANYRPDFFKIFLLFFAVIFHVFAFKKLSEIV